MGKPSPNLLTDPVAATLLRLAAPMVLGIGAVLLFGVVDTFWVAQLGDAQLAAMSYTFPVTAIVMNIGMALGLGTTAATARAIGTGDQPRVAQLATHGLWLALLAVVSVVAVAYTTLDATFTALGASAATLPLVRAYMEPWFIGALLMVLTMVGNGAIRAGGDTRTPAQMMMLAGLLNAGLTPVLMFGLGPFAPMGIRGAAVATAIAWAVSLVVAVSILHFREHLLLFRLDPSAVRRSWRDILHVGLPAMGTNLLYPLSAAVITRTVAVHGDAAVAGFGVASRVEQVALIGIFALSTAITPFVGQNHGARQCERVREAARFSLKASLLWGLGSTAVLVLGSGPLASLFSDGPGVAEVIRSYWLIVAVCYGLLGVASLVNAIFNALGQPLRSAQLTGIRLLALLLPMALIGAQAGGLTGLFVGISAAYGLGGVVAYAMVHRMIDRVEEQQSLELAAAQAGQDPVASGL